MPATHRDYRVVQIFALQKRRENPNCSQLYALVGCMYYLANVGRAIINLSGFKHVHKSQSHQKLGEIDDMKITLISSYLC